MLVHFGVLEGGKELVCEGQTTLRGVLNVSLRVVAVLLIENFRAMDCLGGAGRTLKSWGHFRLLLGVCLLRENCCQLLKV